jgi:hypothetical protein
MVIECRGGFLSLNWRVEGGCIDITPKISKTLSCVVSKLVLFALACFVVRLRLKH